MDAGLLDVLHHAAHHHPLAVRDGVDVDLGGVGEEAVHEHRMLGLMLACLHLAIWWDFGGALSRCLMLAHLGLFLLWQPVWSNLLFLIVVLGGACVHISRRDF